MSLAWGLLTGSIFSFLAGVFFILSSRKTRNSYKRMDNWFDRENEFERKSFVLLIGDKYDSSELASELKKKLIQGNITLKPSEYMGIYILLLALFTFMNHFLFGLFLLMSVLVSYLIVSIGSRFYLNSRRNKRTESFNKQLPEICRMMSNGIKAGQTIPQAIEMVGRDMKDPSQSEFRKMNYQFKLGDSLEMVLNQFRERVSSNDINIFVSTILIQQKVGGNLAEVLSSMAETLEERSRVHKEIQTVTAESRSIAYILVAMPFLMVLMMNLFIKGFLNVLFTPFGLLIFAGFSVIVFFAFFIIKRLSDIRV
ncbi:type II secretion system F family protein [Bacillus sp. DTU_2020_1000418_1_SI_GHA_SEK_038]|uniref:type II secretion system F family protein n=1 Tax=Bacillus sp. DTU_2020_1000418_1_SI_GHA_SEK_038 TaxID=3077585 RepID=UPI0028EC73D5|nr:type II secretion system F family protein [Bacillus sp. DTU_2020_1000418_1_SI_GHA_SEK_038]WNS75993.1 type II secretion system F family protein [Bacillus sp. DTU_2020_1000418_1_SI_GHA_SEK_038]